MWNCVLSAILILGFLSEVRAPALADSLTVQLFPLTGEIRLMNTGPTPVPFVFYSILSPSGALKSSAGVWKSVSGNYDASGNHLIDATNDWVPLSAATTELSEGVVADPGGTLPPTRAISLGRVWDVHRVAFPDLMVEIRQADERQVGITYQFTVDGDFSGNGSTDHLDYDLYLRQTYGSTTNLLNDANLNGVVDAADYVVWRDNLFKTAPLPPYSVGSGLAAANISAVPEPAAEVLVLVLCGVAACRATFARRGRSRTSR